MNVRLLFLFLIFFSSFWTEAKPALTAYEQQCQHFIQSQGSRTDSQRLRELLKFNWTYVLNEYPEMATYVGEVDRDDRWTDLSRAALDRRQREAQCPLRAIATIQRARLKPNEQLTYDLFARDAKQTVEAYEFPSDLLQVQQVGGVHQNIPETLESMPTGSVKAYENKIARLEKAPLLIEQTILLMREGMARKVMPARLLVQDVPQQIRNVLTKEITQSPLYQSFKEFHGVAAPEDQARLREKAQQVIREKVYPAFEKLNVFLEKEYLPQTTDQIAWEALPNGKKWYAERVRFHTTTQMTPEEIHELGLKEVARIRGEMDKAIQAAGFKGSFEDFKKFLRTDSRFYLKSKDELLMRYRDIAKRADPELARLFGKLPRLPYGIKPAPEYSEKSQPTALYEPGSPKSGRPGYFVANTYDLKTRPSWEMEALTLHEAVPGHHLQLALAQEMDDVPEFRKHHDSTAFIEGWGLYAESLGLELGFYKDPYSNFGRLVYEMWRACRLVVDTGMHHMGWSREKSIQFMKENTAKTGHDIEVEVDRYIAWPGQALAYKIGELTFKRLRAEAQQKLGSRFDVRKFHDVLLQEGALPMDVVEARMHAWMNMMLK